MVTKYIILADSKNTSPHVIPRQLTEISGEPLIKRTIRLLKKNGVHDIIVTSHDKRFDDLGAKRYEPLYNEFDPFTLEGYWLNAFPIELLNEPVCFIFGDVYFSENAIKKIVKTPTDSTLFFCAYQNTDSRYIKHHDEPLAYKVADYETFKKHIDIVKKMKNEGKCCREPIVWELYRSINGQDVNIHEMSTNYVAINDESCDIDTIDDIIELEKVIGGNNMIKCEVVKEFTLEKFDELKNIQRKGVDTKGKLYVGDTFECGKAMADYLMGKNDKGIEVVKVIEVEPEVKEEPQEEIKETKPVTFKKKKSSKK